MPEVIVPKAIPKAVDPPVDSSLTWTMGLKGVWATLANVSAIGLICLMFYQTHQENVHLVREERALFREELTRMREEQKVQWDLQAKNTQAINTLVDSVRQLTLELKNLKDNRKSDSE